MNYKQAFLPLFEHIYKNDTAAIELSFAVLDVMHTWDDLVDRDKPVDNMAINTAFMLALTVIPVHKYWNSVMHTMLVNTYLKWQAANKFEAGDEQEHIKKAWMLRAGVFDLFLMLATQLYGVAWGEDCAPAVYAFYGEKLEDFLTEVAECRTQ